MLGCGSSQVRRRQIVNKWWKPELVRAAEEMCVCLCVCVCVWGQRTLALWREVSETLPGARGKDFMAQETNEQHLQGRVQPVT